MRLIDADALKEWIENWFTMNRRYHPYSRSNNIPTTELIDIIDRMPAVDSVGGVRCKDCIHKPKPTVDYNPNERDGFEIKFPDYICPMQCEDAYYNRIPKDDWFCADAERRQE